MHTYEKIFGILKTSKYNSQLNNTISSFNKVPSQVDSFNFKITSKKYLSENDPILTSEIFDKDAEIKLSKTINRENKSMRSIDSLNMVSPSNISQKRSKENYGDIIFQTGFSNISQISKVDFCEKKEDILKEKEEFESIQHIEKIQTIEPCVKKNKSKDCSETSFKVNDTTGNSKNIEYNTLSGRVSTGRSLAKIFNEKKRKLESSYYQKNYKNIPEAHADIISPKSLNINKFNIEYNHVPSEIILVESPIKKTSSKIKQYSALNNPNMKSITDNSNSTTINNAPTRKHKGVIKSMGINLVKGKALDKSNSVMRIYSTKNNSISSPLAMKNNSKINDWIQERKKKHENTKSITQWRSLATSKSISRYNVKAEEGIEKNKEIQERIKKIPNLKRTLEKNLKRPASVAEYNMICK